MLGRDTVVREGIHGGGGGSQLIPQVIAPIPRTALLLACSPVSGFGFLRKKVYNLLKIKTK